MLETVIYSILFAQIPLAVMIVLTILLGARWVFGIIGVGAIGLAFVWIKHVATYGAPIHRHSSPGEELFFIGATIIATAVGLYVVGYAWVRRRIRHREQLCRRMMEIQLCQSGGRVSMFRTLTTLSLIVAVVLVPQSQVLASSNMFQFYKRICIVVYELPEDDARRFRADISLAVATEVQRRATVFVSWMKIASPPNCIQPLDPTNYSRQVQLELSIKHQKVFVSGEAFFADILGGSSPNARGPLSEYELQPVLHVAKSQMTDAEATTGLVDFVDRSILQLMRSQ